MLTNRSQVLNTIFEQIENIPEQTQSRDPFVNIKNALQIFELYLKRLQDLKNNLPDIEELHKADVIKLMKCIRKIYTPLDVYKDVSEVLTHVREGLNNPSVIFKGSELTDSLLLNKHIIVLNRNIFAAKRTIEIMRKNGTLVS